MNKKQPGQPSKTTYWRSLPSDDEDLLETRLIGLKELRNDLQTVIERTLAYEEYLLLGVGSIDFFRKQMQGMIDNLSLMVQDCESRIKACRRRKRSPSIQSTCRS